MYDKTGEVLESIFITGTEGGLVEVNVGGDDICWAGVAAALSVMVVLEEGGGVGMRPDLMSSRYWRTSLWMSMRESGEGRGGERETCLCMYVCEISFSEVKLWFVIAYFALTNSYYLYTSLLSVYWRLYPFKILSFGPEGFMRERSDILLVSTRYFTAGEREIVATDAVE